MPKKTKAIKQSDVKAQKPWLKKIIASEYEVETKETNKVILIVCEGQTEKLYFESFPVLTLTVEAIDLQGQSKLKLVETTASIIKNYNGKYDKVWCVFDMDVKKGENEFSDFDNAILSAKSKNINVAYSNDAFELWFYLHYQYTDHQNLRKFYYQFLSGIWNINYVKDGKKRDFCLSLYNKLEVDQNASQNDAIDRAEKLYLNQYHLDYHKQNPVTTVYGLVKFLNESKRK